MKRWIKRENNRTAQGLLLMLVSLFLLCSTAVWCADFRANAEEVKEDERSIEGSADIVFVIDSTGSMYEYITSVKQNLTSFVQALNSRKVTLKMSVIEFRDIEVDGPDSTIYYEFDGSHWTSDADKVIRVFDSIQVDGGGDEPETPLDAFEKIEFPEDDAKKFIFLLSDASFKDYDSSSYGHRDMEGWTNFYRENNIKATVVSQACNEPDYSYLYSLTGGRFIDILSDNYYELMLEYSEWIYESIIDSDGDGLPDDWEINGVDKDHDGTIDLDLAAMGADPNVPDIFIEADWMESSGSHACYPSATALKMVYDRFKAHGINMHIDAGPDSIMNYETNAVWGSLSGASAIPYQDVFYLGGDYQNWNHAAIDHFTAERWTTFRYCLFVNRYDAGRGNDSSGIAENIPGQFFIVAMDIIPHADYDVALAGTIMHELGHTLGLSHGGLYADGSTGALTSSHERYKPNHLSIMNYEYQFNGLLTISGNRYADYQNFDLPEIDENHINEYTGIDPYEATKGTGLAVNGVEIAGAPIDFNGNGVLENDIRMDLNVKNGNNKIETLTATKNEWNNLRYTGGLISGYGERADVSDVTTLITKPENVEPLVELTLTEAYEKGLLGDPGECSFRNVEQKSLYSEMKDQILHVDIDNLYPEQTTVKLEIKADALGLNYANDVIVNKDGAGVNVPLTDNLSLGSYAVTYQMTLADGTVVKTNGRIDVKAPDQISMNSGETMLIPYDPITSCTSSDSSVIQVSGNRLVAGSAGVSYVLVTMEPDCIYYAKITVHKAVTPATEEPEEETTAPMEEPTEEVTEEPTEDKVPFIRPEPETTEETETDQATVTKTRTRNRNNSSGGKAIGIVFVLILVCGAIATMVIFLTVSNNKKKSAEKSASDRYNNNNFNNRYNNNQHNNNQYHGNNYYDR